MEDGIDLRAAQNLYIGTGACVAAYFNNEKIWPQKEYVLPEGYTALDYIENIANGSATSAAYLSTGLEAANDLEIYIEYEDNFYYTSMNCSNYIVGARNGSNGTILMGIGGSTGSNTYNVNCNGNSVQPISNYSRTRGKKYTVDLKYSSTGLNYSVTIDEGTPVTGTLGGNITTAGVPLCIFAWNSANVKSNTRVYKCIIKKAGQIVRYYLPCISPDNVVGLYDCANTAGTGFSGSSNSSKFYGPGIASYLTFTSQGNANGIQYRAATTATSGTAYTINYSIDGGLSWPAINASTGTTAFTTLSSGATVMIRAAHIRYSTSSGVFNRFSSTGNYKVSGNIMSLIGAGNFMASKTISSSYTFCKLFLSSSTLTDSSELYLPATTLANNCYYYMFDGCTSLTTAPELPATTLAQSCYQYMFRNCTSLTTAPELPATTLAGSCYQYMFYGCTSLTTAPELPATALTGYCYHSMFYGCTSLTTAPELPATALTNYCYYYMFRGCTSLNYVKCLAEASINTSNYSTSNWLNGVSSTGTFIKSPNTTASTTSSGSGSVWPRSMNGIPTNWTVQDA